MDFKKSSKLITAVIIVSVAIISFCIFEASVQIPASARGKSKWQRLLEKNSVARTFWERYLPNITRKEYLKVKNFLTGSFQAQNVATDPSSRYFLHQNISTTYFWTGEDANGDNHNISNSPSCWDDKWCVHFGGIDNPDRRNGFMPAAFTPKENPFYFALPYNDFDSNGKRKSGLADYIPWYGEKSWADNESVCKNRWIKIMKGDKVAYAQWQDAGPFGENDINYVFGTAQPKSKANNNAGLDVSPAVRDYLNLSDVDKTSWQFVDAKDVPDGPWKNIITTSSIYWN